MKNMYVYYMLSSKKYAVLKDIQDLKRKCNEKARQQIIATITPTCNNSPIGNCLPKSYSPYTGPPVNNGFS